MRTLALLVISLALFTPAVLGVDVFVGHALECLDYDVNTGGDWDGEGNNDRLRYEDGTQRINSKKEKNNLWVRCNWPAASTGGNFPSTIDAITEVTMSAHVMLEKKGKPIDNLGWRLGNDFNTEVGVSGPSPTPAEDDGDDPDDPSDYGVYVSDNFVNSESLTMSSIGSGSFYFDTSGKDDVYFDYLERYVEIRVGIELDSISPGNGDPGDTVRLKATSAGMIDGFFTYRAKFGNLLSAGCTYVDNRNVDCEVPGSVSAPSYNVQLQITGPGVTTVNTVNTATWNLNLPPVPTGTTESEVILNEISSGIIVVGTQMEPGNGEADCRIRYDGTYYVSAASDDGSGNFRCDIPGVVDDDLTMEVQIRNRDNQAWVPSTPLEVDLAFPEIDVNPDGYDAGVVTLPIGGSLVIPISNAYESPNADSRCRIFFPSAVPGGTDNVNAVIDEGANTITCDLPTHNDCADCGSLSVRVQVKTDQASQGWSNTEATFLLQYPDPVLTGGSIPGRSTLDVPVGDGSYSITLTGTDIYDSPDLECRFTPASGGGSAETRTANWISLTSASCPIPAASDLIDWDVQLSAAIGGTASYDTSKVTIDVIYDAPLIEGTLTDDNNWVTADPGNVCSGNSAVNARVIQLVHDTPGVALVNSPTAQCVWGVDSTTLYTSATWNSGIDGYDCQLPASTTSGQTATLALRYDPSTETSTSATVFVIGSVTATAGVSGGQVPGPFNTITASGFIANAPAYNLPTGDSTSPDRTGAGLQCEVRWSIDNGATVNHRYVEGVRVSDTQVYCIMPYISPSLDPNEYTVYFSPDGCSWAGPATFGVGQALVGLDSITRNWEWADAANVETDPLLNGCPTLAEGQTVSSPDIGNPPVYLPETDCLWAPALSGSPLTGTSDVLCALREGSGGTLETFGVEFYGSEFSPNAVFGCNLDVSDLTSFSHPYGKYQFVLESDAGGRGASNAVDFYILVPPEPTSMTVTAGPVDIQQVTIAVVDNNSLQVGIAGDDDLNPFPTNVAAGTKGPWYKWTGSGGGTDSACGSDEGVPCQDIYADTNECHALTPDRSSPGVCELWLSNGGNGWVFVDSYSFQPLPALTSVIPVGGNGPYLSKGSKTIRVSGSNFLASAEVRFSGSLEYTFPCTNVDASGCDISVNNIDEGVYSVDVSNSPTIGAGTYSGSVSFTSLPPVTVDSLSPSTANAALSSDPVVTATFLSGTIPGAGSFSAVYRVNGGSTQSLGGSITSGTQAGTMTLSRPTLPLSAGELDEFIEVSVDGGATWSDPRTFAWTQEVTVTDVTPDTHFAAGGTSVTVTVAEPLNTGVGLLSYRFIGPTVTTAGFGSSVPDAPPNVFSFTFFMPELEEGTHNIQVSVRAGASWSVSNAASVITVLPNPQPELVEGAALSAWWPAVPINPYPPTCPAECELATVESCCLISVYASQFKTDSQVFYGIDGAYERGQYLAVEPADVATPEPRSIERRFDMPPLGIAQDVQFSVSNDGLAGPNVTFRFHDPPLATVSPTSGPLEGGTTVVFQGAILYDAGPHTLADDTTYLWTDYKVKFGVVGEVVTPSLVAPGVINVVTPQVASIGFLDIFIAVNGRDFYPCGARYEFTGSGGELDGTDGVSEFTVIVIAAVSAVSVVALLVGGSVYAVKRFGQVVEKEDDDEAGEAGEGDKLVKEKAAKTKAERKKLEAEKKKAEAELRKAKKEVKGQKQDLKKVKAATKSGAAAAALKGGRGKSPTKGKKTDGDGDGDGKKSDAWELGSYISGVVHEADETRNKTSNTMDNPVKKQRPGSSGGAGRGGRKPSTGGPGARKGSSAGPGARKGSTGAPGARKGSTGGPGARKGSTGGPGARKGSTGGAGRGGGRGGRGGRGGGRGGGSKPSDPPPVKWD